MTPEQEDSLLDQLSRIADALEGIEYDLKKIMDGSAVISVDAGEINVNAKCSGVIHTEN